MKRKWRQIYLLETVLFRCRIADRWNRSIGSWLRFGIRPAGATIGWDRIFPGRWITRGAGSWGMVGRRRWSIFNCRRENLAVKWVWEGKDQGVIHLPRQEYGSLRSCNLLWAQVAFDTKILCRRAVNSPWPLRRGMGDCRSSRMSNLAPQGAQKSTVLSATWTARPDRHWVVAWWTPELQGRRLAQPLDISVKAACSFHEPQLEIIIYPYDPLSRLLCHSNPMVSQCRDFSRVKASCMSRNQSFVGAADSLRGLPGLGSPSRSGILFLPAIFGPFLEPQARMAWWIERNIWTASRFPKRRMARVCRHEKNPSRPCFRISDLAVDPRGNSCPPSQKRQALWKYRPEALEMLLGLQSGYQDPQKKDRTASADEYIPATLPHES